MRDIRRGALAALAALAVGLALVPALAAAEGREWPRFRGPDGVGVADAPSLPVAWSENEVNWKVALPGGGHSSPVVWGDRIFVTAADEASAKRILVCLKVSDGSVLWRREFESRPCHLNGLNSYASQTPAVDAGRVVVCWATPEEFPVVALDHDGRDLWRRDLGPFKSQHGHGASPILFDGLAIVTNDQQGPSFIVALGAADGKTRWQTERRAERAAYSVPSVFRPEGRPPQLILTASSCGMTSLDPATGKVNWEVPDLFPERVVSCPVVAGGLVLGTCGTGGRGREVVAVRPPATAVDKPAVAWRIKDDAPYVPTAVAYGDFVFLWTEGGVVQCVRAATGERVWRERVRGEFYGSPVCAGGRLYAISVKGEVVVLEAGETFKEVGRTALGEKSHATPAVAAGRMYLRTWSHLVSVGR